MVRVISLGKSRFTPLNNGLIRAELDSHADTCCFGSACHIVAQHGKTVSVEPFEDSLGRLDDISILDVAVAFDDPITLQTWMLIFRQVLYIPSMTCHLLNPMQLRLHGIVVNDIASFVPIQPMQYPVQHLDFSHSIYDPETQLRIPMRLDGVVSYFPCRKPTKEEFDQCPRIIEMTASLPEWDPHDRHFSEMQESAMNHIYQYPVEHDVAGNTHVLDVMKHLVSRFEKVSRYIGGTKSSKRKGTVTPVFESRVMFNHGSNQEP